MEENPLDDASAGLTETFGISTRFLRLLGCDDRITKNGKDVKVYASSSLKCNHTSSYLQMRNATEKCGYHLCPKTKKTKLLNEYCKVTGQNRKAVIRKMRTGQKDMLQALWELKKKYPFRWKEVHPDNGTEFIIGFSRSRPYGKNDNCFVEQKNSTQVRKMVGHHEPTL